MLQTIRERAQGWIAWAIVILISIPFALWGIQSYLGVGSEPVVAQVNGVEITQRALDQRYQETRMRLRERLGSAYRPELFDEQIMRAQVLERMIEEILILQVAQDLGLRASDQELRLAILLNPAFQKDGRFDKSTYQRMLALQGTSEAQYEDSLRRRVLGTQLQRAIEASAFITESELAEAVRLEKQRRQVQLIRLPKDQFLSDAPIPDAEIQAYYEAHRDRFRSPERVKLQYLLLNVATMDLAEPPTEEALRQRYEAEKDRFRKPEQRRARHILIALDPQADAQAEAQAKAKIEAVRERLVGGEDFAEVAKEVSEDPGSAPQGGDLGWFGRGLMDPAFEQAAFRLKQDEISAPVRSAFGYHLIQVTGIQPETIQPFEQVKDKLRAEIAKEQGEGRFFDWAERLANLAYEHPDSLEPAADALGLQIQESDWIDRQGGEGILANPKVLAAAFSAEVLEEGLNSELIEPEPGVLQAIVLRVVAHEPARVKPLETVRDTIITQLRDQAARTAAKAKADAVLEKLKKGEPIEGYAVQDLGTIGRDAFQVPEAVRKLAFSLPRPKDDQPSLGSTSLENGDGAVVQVKQVIDGKLADLKAPEREALKRRMVRALGQGYYERFLEDLKARADIERKPLETASDF